MSDEVVKILTPEGGVMTVRGTVIPPEVNLDETQFGAGLPIFEQLRLLAQWGPMLGYLQAVVTAPTARDKSLAILSALLFAAGKTQTTVDDDVVKHLEAMLRSPEGAAFFDWLAKTIKVPA